MRLLGLEIKRVLKTRITWVLLVSALVLSVLMAYVPVTFQYYTYKDENGQKVELKGMEAIRYMKKEKADLVGEVTPQKVREAVEAYQDCLNEYGAESTLELPNEVIYERLRPYSPFIPGVREAFADPDTGIAPGIMEIDSAEVEKYYEKCTEHLESLMVLEQRAYPSAQEQAKEKYSQVTFPFTYYYGIEGDSMDYQILLIFLITIFCTVIAAPIFSSDYQTGADDILRCTKHGRARLGVVKVMSALIICGICYLVCVAVWILVTNSLFGWESTKTSMQMIFSVVNLPDMNIGQLELFVMLATFLCFLASVSFTLFLSSKMKGTMPALAISIMFCMLPLIVYIGVPGTAKDWLRCILPGGGIGLQNCLLYALIDFDFLHIGTSSIWNANMILAAAAVELPLFTGLAIFSYCRRRS